MVKLRDDYCNISKVHTRWCNTHDNKNRYESMKHIVKIMALIAMRDNSDEGLIELIDCTNCMSRLVEG